MRYLVFGGAVLALAACDAGESDTMADADVMAEDTMVADAGGPMAADGMPTPGTYRITDADGEVSTEIVNADGTFTSTSADGTVESGRWVQKSPEQFCVTMDEEGAQEECFDEMINEDGVWLSTDADGTSSTVERIDP